MLGYFLIVPDITRFATALVVSKINSNKEGSMVLIGEPAFFEEGISLPVNTAGCIATTAFLLSSSAKTFQIADLLDKSLRN